MASSRLAVLLDWASDPFCFYEQMRTAFRFAQDFEHDNIVFGIEFGVTDTPTPADILAIGETRLSAPAAALEAGFPKHAASLRALMYETGTRAALDTRYQRVNADAAPGDRGANSIWRVPRDGAIDFKDANLWLLPDWVGDHKIYPARPIATTYHPLADLLTPAHTAESAFSKRMLHQTAAITAAAPNDLDSARKRFGLGAERVSAWRSPAAALGEQNRRILVISDNANDTETAKTLIERQSTRRNAAPILATIAEVQRSGPQGAIRTVELDSAARQRSWIARTKVASLSIVREALANAHSIALMVDAEPRAFAIANWVEQGRQVSFYSAMPERTFQRWPSVHTTSRGDIAGLIKLAESATGRAP